VFVQAFTPFHPAIQYARRHDFVGFYDQELEFREQLKYPPVSRVALLTLKGRNEEKVRFSAEHVRRELDKLVSGRGEKENGGKGEAETSTLFDQIPPLPLFPSAPPPASTPAHFRDLVIAGPAPAPLLRAETFYRYQLMLRTRAMSRLSHALAQISLTLALPDDVTLTVDIDPVSLS
jgi:primosomal protein N' (replication factor Y) (superfamily II helicase)